MAHRGRLGAGGFCAPLHMPCVRFDYRNKTKALVVSVALVEKLIEMRGNCVFVCVCFCVVNTSLMYGVNWLHKAYLFFFFVWARTFLCVCVRAMLTKDIFLLACLFACVA